MNINEIELMAEKGDAKAQTILGVCYAHGEGVERDPTKALSLFLEAAKQNEPSALANTGECYMYGIGTKKNMKLAISFLSRACDYDIPEALSSLGTIYVTGDGVDANPQKAVTFFSRAAEQNFPEAIANLGRCYFEGVGVDKNMEKALSLFSQAHGYGALSEVALAKIAEKVDDVVRLADERNRDAQYFAGLIFWDAIGVSRDLEKAFNYYHQAAEQGHAIAMFLIGDKFFQAEDYFHAEYWLEKSIHSGGKKAAAMLEEARQAIYNNGKYLLVKILDKEWAEKFIGGDLFMRYLGYFGGINLMMSEDSSIDNEYRGDKYEGLGATLGDKQEGTAMGLYEERFAQRKIFCMYALDIDEKRNVIMPIDPRISDFGDTAIVIIDVPQFLSRVTAALSSKYGDKYWCSYSRVKYDLNLQKDRTYCEFNKKASLAWQREFRVSLDLSDGRISKRTWDSMTDFVRFTNPWKVDDDALSDFNSEAIIVNIGNIRDICIEVATNELIENCEKYINETLYPIPKANTLLHPNMYETYMGVFRPAFFRTD